MNCFVTDRFKMILKRDYGFDPKVEETPEGMKFTITVNNPDLRRFMAEMTHPRIVGVEEKIDRETGNKYKAPIIKNVTFINATNVMDKNCNTLTFCLDADETGAVKMNIIEHGLRTFMTSRPGSNISI